MDRGTKSIAVPGVSIEIPIIGFGCSSLASVGKEKALRLLETAYDAGVRHFDVAPYYWYGEAEGLLGNFARARRGSMTITTKFGIEPPKRTSALRLAMQAGRRLVRLVPAARSFLSRRAQGLVKSGGFSAQDAQASLERSLRELRTDYIDFFLLHDYQFSEEPPNELIAFLTATVKAGKIRYFGLGTSIEHIVRAMQTQPKLCGVVQFENSVLQRNVKRLPQEGPQPLRVTFGALGASHVSLSGRLKANSELTRKWSTQLGLDCSKDETLSTLMLNFAIQANPNGLVLFSSRDAQRVEHDIRGVLESDISAAQVSLFGQLVERDLVPATQAV
jgi:aryl-alcohol dehydrogenase-like predicted oxidoreductase